MNTYTKGIDEPLIFIECLQLLVKLTDENIIQKDVNHPDNILIYRGAANGNPEGWYSENILSVAQYLLNDISGQRTLRNALIEKGIDMEFKDVLSPIDNILKAVAE